MGISQSGFHKEYRKEARLSSGSYGTVYKVRQKKTKKYFACKALLKKEHKTPKKKELLAREIKILKAIDHPNCCKFIKCFENDRKVYIIQELMRGGTLYERFVQSEINETQVARIIHKTTAAIKYLHSKGIIHRDLKPQNIMFEKPISEDPKMESLKVLDFGFAKNIEKQGYTSSSRGTPRYVAPEVVIPSSRGLVRYGASCDMWSIGVIMYELLSGVPPFEDRPTLRQYFLSIDRPDLRFPPAYWSEISKSAQGLIRGLLTRNVKSRLTAEEVLKHKWFHACFVDKKAMRHRRRESIARRNKWLQARKARLKKMVFRLQLRRTVQFVRLFIRYRDTVNTLLELCSNGPPSMPQMTTLLREGSLSTPTPKLKPVEPPDSKFRAALNGTPLIGNVSKNVAISNTELRRLCKLLHRRAEETYPSDPDSSMSALAVRSPTCNVHSENEEENPDSLFLNSNGQGKQPRRPPII
mmetsp:Transcript_13627/g.20499  ORF Transcript_13627/g.20499 Transcript_13627/m.20499 type:complete len:469 (+) Transcript_13627:141-1547(+)|eukprot:CAMPEP_0167752770 /NCGR_PEP_ID=MMETSP0110_2-20121227/7327_1 /TAXON_ID=629695 /ORGANISM="Gymnochlora sp., Strain CCMP2014" /LENGTH=468 /DNA_ID=CAMNT_0007638431 /DNA_START=100 /DNA_END=1506 /DNA_ORIENTATION=-